MKYKLKPLNQSDYSLQIVEDLGMVFAVSKSKITRRHAIFKCSCGNEFRCMVSSVKTGNTTGCKSCGNELRGESMAKTRVVKAGNEFEGRSKEIHGDTYNYDEVVYVHSQTKVSIHCNTCDTTFNQEPASHLNGHGCPSCAVYSFKLLQPAQLYYFKIRFNNQWIYKIGITNKTWKNRYNKIDRENITIIKTWQFDLGQTAYGYEQGIMKAYKDYKYEGDTPFTDRTGVTECFSCDVYNIGIINK